MEWTEVKGRLVICSPILAISLMGGPNSSESNELAQGKVFFLRELPVKRFVLPNSSCKSKKSWCSMDDVPPMAHRPRLSKPTGQRVSDVLRPHQGNLSNSPTLPNSPPLKTTAGRLLNNSRFLASDHRDLSHLSSPTGYIYYPPAPALPAGVLGTHSNRYAPPPPCLSCAFDNPKPIRAVTYNSSLLS